MTVRAWWSVALGAVVTFGCTDERSGGQSGTAHPEMCVEESREAVSDPSVAATGFDFAANEVLAAMEGDWEGTADLDGDATDDTIQVTVAWDEGPIDAVLWHLEPSDSGTTLALGVPSPACRPTYEIGFRLDVASAPWLDVGGDLTLEAAQASGQYLQLEVDAGNLGGKLAPPAWGQPDLWDRTSLSAVFQELEGAARLDLVWWAINDDPKSSASPDGTQSTATASSGTVQPSGKTEPLASVMLTRQ